MRQSPPPLCLAQEIYTGCLSEPWKGFDTKTLTSYEVEVLIGAQLTENAFKKVAEKCRRGCEFANTDLRFHNASLVKWASSEVWKIWKWSQKNDRCIAFPIICTRFFFALKFTKWIHFLWLISNYNVIICVAHEYPYDLNCKRSEWMVKYWQSHLFIFHICSEHAANCKWWTFSKNNVL